MTRILKYQPLASNAAQRVPGHVIAVGWQHGDVTVWCEVDDPERPVGLTVVPTGATTPADAQYVGSAISDFLVFHVYERDLS